MATTHGVASDMSLGYVAQQLDHQAQLELRKQIRNKQSMYTTLMDCLAIEPNENKWFKLGVMLQAEIDELLRDLKDEYLNYFEHLEGEQDNLHEITTQSWVGDDGRITGPMYSFGVREWERMALLNEIDVDDDGQVVPGNYGYWPMSQSHVDQRQTRLENTNRLRDDTEDEGEMNEHDWFVENISTVDSRLSYYNLAVYVRRGMFLENIRILRNGGQPLCVDSDFEAPQQMKTANIPVTVHTGKVEVTREPLYDIVRVGRHDIKVRVKRARCALLRAIYEDAENCPIEVEIGFRKCAAKMHDMNLFTICTPVMAKKQIKGPDGRPLIDEQGHRVYETKEVEYVAQGGLEWKQSLQLAPDKNPELRYNSNPRFSLIGPNASSLKRRFMQRVTMGAVKECTYVWYDDKGKRHTKKQVYAVLPFKRPDRTVFVVVFSDLQRRRFG